VRQVSVTIEYLIYLYIFICICLMGFNTWFLVVRKRRNRVLDRRSQKLFREIRSQMNTDSVSKKHLEHLEKNMKKYRFLMAFDRAVEMLKQEEPEAAAKYLDEVMPVFRKLALHFRKCPDMEQAYFAFIIAKYCQGRGREMEELIKVLVGLICSRSPYVRENTLRALYSLGDPYSVIYAMTLLNENKVFHHQKLLVDGMNRFQGRHDLLAKGLWERFERFSPEFQVVIVDYLRYQKEDFCAEMADLLTKAKVDKEVRLAVLRYFRNRPYEPIRKVLYGFVTSVTIENWEEGALAASALGAFTDDETIRILCGALTSKYWYLRFNSIEALQRIGIDEKLEAQILNGEDRFARELTQYKQAVLRMKKETEGR